MKFKKEMAKGLAGKTLEHPHCAECLKGHEKDMGYNHDKMGKVMHEFKEGSLRSGSKHGPKVKSRKQAVAIALSEARKRV